MFNGPDGGVRGIFASARDITDRVRLDEIGSWDISRGEVPDTDPDKPREIILDISNLDIYYGSKKVVHGVTLDVGKAEVVALVGESGSGKTTLARALLGLVQPTTGAVVLDGKRIELR